MIEEHLKRLLTKLGSIKINETLEIIIENCNETKSKFIRKAYFNNKVKAMNNKDQFRDN